MLRDDFIVGILPEESLDSDKCAFLFRPLPSALSNMNLHVCPPWYQCRCPRGKPVSERTMLRHMAAANNVRRQLGRGLFKRGPKITQETMSVYTFNCEDSLEENLTDAEENLPRILDQSKGISNHNSSNDIPTREEVYESQNGRFINVDSPTPIVASVCERVQEVTEVADTTDRNDSVNQVSSQDNLLACNEARNQPSNEHSEQFQLTTEPVRVISQAVAPVQGPAHETTTEQAVPISADNKIHDLDFEDGTDHFDEVGSGWNGDQPFSPVENAAIGSRIPGITSWLRENHGWVDLFYTHGLTHSVMDDILHLIYSPCRRWKTVISNIVEANPAVVKDYSVCPGHCCFTNLLNTPEVNSCTICGKDRPSPDDISPSDSVSYIPLFPRLKGMIEDETFSEPIYSYRRSLQHNSDSTLCDYFDSQAFQDLCDFYGGQNNLEHDLFIAASTDGFQAYKNNTFDVWPLVAVLFNLHPHIRFISKNVLPLMFIPNDVQPKDLQSYMIPFVNEVLSTLEDGGIEAILPNGERIYFRIHLIWFTADLAGLVKLAGITGHMGRHPCRFSLLQGYYSSVHQHYYYPTWLQPLSPGEPRIVMYNPRHLAP